MISTDKYIGIPYESHGRGVSGLDCWGLVWLVYRQDLGIELPSWSAEYERASRVNLAKITGKKNLFYGWKEVVMPIPGDVALFDMSGLLHVGICLDYRGLRMMHIMRGSNVTIERLDSVIWRENQPRWYRYA